MPMLSTQQQSSFKHQPNGLTFSLLQQGDSTPHHTGVGHWKWFTWQEKGKGEGGKKKKEKQTRSCPLVSLTNYNVRYIQLATSLIESYLYNLDLSKLVSLTLPLFLKIKPPLLSFHPLFRAQNRSAKLDYNFSYEPINPFSWKNPLCSSHCCFIMMRNLSRCS